MVELAALTDVLMSNMTTTAAPDEGIGALLDSWFKSIIVDPLSKVVFFDVFFWDNCDDKDPNCANVVVPLVVAWLVFWSITLTVVFKFVNFRAFCHAIAVVRGKFTDPEEHGEISHFQALSAALSATVGLGNIAGVAVAVSTGGPGAIFWMVCMGLLGMTSKFAECALGQKYKITREDGHISGGAFQYLSDGLGIAGYVTLGKVLAVVFSCMSIGGSFGGGNMFQANQAYVQMASIIPALDGTAGSVIFGLVMAAAVGVVILGGVESIAAVAGTLVPIMCGVYVFCGLSILAVNISAVPSSCVLIVSSALTGNALYGGFVGQLVKGVQRAAFSNEAGCGSAPIVHSAAKTNEPLREGLVALLEPFIDTVVVCTITGLVLVVTDAYKLGAPDVPENERLGGIEMTSWAFDQVFPGFRYLLSFIALLFAFSTMISWSYYGEQSCVYLFGVGSITKYKMSFLFFTFLGCNISAGSVIDFSDMMILGASFPNLLGVGLMLGVLREMYDDYFTRLYSGDMRRFSMQGTRSFSRRSAAEMTQELSKS